MKKNPTKKKSQRNQKKIGKKAAANANQNRMFLLKFIDNWFGWNELKYFANALKEWTNHTSRNKEAKNIGQLLSLDNLFYHFILLWVELGSQETLWIIWIFRFALSQKYSSKVSFSQNMFKLLHTSKLKLIRF